MTLSYKTRLIVGTAFLGLIVVLYFVSENIFRQSYGDVFISLRQQEIAIASLILMIVIFGLVVGALTIYLLEKQVLYRLLRLSESIRDIGTTGDFSARVSLPGADELTHLAQTINGMLSALQHSEGELSKLYEKEKQLRRKLETEMKKRIEFTRALVHEIKTPLTPVLASSDMLLQNTKDKILHGLAQNIYQGATNLDSRIDELLDLAKGEIGMLRLNLEPIDPRHLLQKIYNEAAPVALRNEQDLKIELPDSLSTVWVDEERFRQVVLNLMNNAFKFTPPGGQVTLKARQKDANLVVEVHDSGPGIDKEDQQLLFEPYQILKGDKEHLSGLGLGLSLSKQLVELHGGQISVESQKGKGSIFGFSLPIKPPTRSKPEEGE